MRQLIAFNASKGGSKPGYCLQNVRLGFGIAPLHNDAWTAWRNSEQHTSSIPTNVDVPLYYDYTDRNGNRYGHINVRLADGRVWNDGKTYRDLAHYQQNSTTKYVGWSTEVNNVKVLEGDSMNATEKDVRDYFGVWLKRSPTQSQINHYTRTHWRKLIDDVLGEYKRGRDREVKTYTDLIKELQRQNKELEAQLALVGDDTKNLNQLGYFLRWVIERLGLRK